MKEASVIRELFYSGFILAKCSKFYSGKMQQTERKCQTVWVERGWQWHFPHLEILYLLIKLQHICQILWELFLCMFLCACTSLYWINLPLMPSVCDYIVLGLIPISWTVKQCRYREMTRRHDCNPLHSTFFVWCCAKKSNIQHYSWTFHCNGGKWDDMEQRFPTSSGALFHEYNTWYQKISVWNLMCICSQFFCSPRWTYAHCLHQKIFSNMSVCMNSAIFPCVPQCIF